MNRHRLYLVLCVAILVGTLGCVAKTPVATSPKSAAKTLVGKEFEYNDLIYKIISDTECALTGNPDFICNDEMVIPAEVVYNSKKYSVTTVGRRAFIDCDGITTITFPSTMRKIEEQAFFGCGNLIALTLPSSVHTIGKEAFAECSDLRSISIPQSIEQMGTGVFKNCPMLSFVIFKSNIKELPAETFSNNPKLDRIFIYNPTPPRIGSECFNKYSQRIIIYVPANSISAYKTESDWKMFPTFRTLNQ